MAGASLGKVVDILSTEQILYPIGKLKWMRVAIDHFLSNSKYIDIVGLERFVDVQLEKSVRCNVDYDKADIPCRAIRYVFHAMTYL
jgi:hypothetical protein